MTQQILKLSLITGRTKRDIVDILGIDLGSCISRNEKTGSLGKGRKVSLLLGKTKQHMRPPQRDMFSVWNPWRWAQGELWWACGKPASPALQSRARTGMDRTSNYSWTLVSVFAPSYVLWDHSTMGWIMVLSLDLSTFKDHGSLHWALDLGWSPQQ